ncbi:hypothetical protein FQA39_LY18855 [Lamprigera yunnana]|nr:hypothetical protein FQA39_LY18855 [Lamprigera yunnana]
MEDRSEDEIYAATATTIISIMSALKKKKQQERNLWSKLKWKQQLPYSPTSIFPKSAVFVCWNAKECILYFSEIRSVGSLQEETTYLYEILMNISSIRILLNDGLPTMICTNCMELTHAFYKFQQQCNHSQELLDGFILSANIDLQEPSDKDVKLFDLDVNLASTTPLLFDEVQNEVAQIADELLLHRGTSYLLAVSESLCRFDRDLSATVHYLSTVPRISTFLNLSANIELFKKRID